MQKCRKMKETSPIPLTHAPISLQLFGHAMLSIFSATDELPLFSVFNDLFSRNSEIHRSIKASFGLSAHSREPFVSC